MYLEYAKLRIYPSAVLLTSMIGSLCSPVYASDAPRSQDFVVTAYYSPLPNQSAYFRGNYEDEIAFNGKGIKSADQTPVYVGMIAAPNSYDFGTRIDLGALGVGTVHDRGGRIIEWGDELHRIDLWMGRGEEGLARALAWGTRRVTGTVYPVRSDVMPAEHFSLDSIPADVSILVSMPKADPVDLLMQASFGDSGSAVRLLQSTLKNLGYFVGTPNAQFGPATQKSLQAFLLDVHVRGDGSAVDEDIAAALTVASNIRDENLPDIHVGLARGSRGSDVRQIQKLMRFLGLYRGRTDGVFGRELKESVTAFQIRSGILAQALDSNAGRVGPATKRAILAAWKMKIVSMKTASIANKIRIAKAVRDQKKLPSAVLSVGSHGKDVRTLQSFLVTHGYLTSKDITGSFASRTESALLKYQLDRNIINSSHAHGAGVFGPATKAAAIRDLVAVKWQDMRANGNVAL